MGRLKWQKTESLEGQKMKILKRLKTGTALKILTVNKLLIRRPVLLAQSWKLIKKTEKWSQLNTISLVSA